MSLLNRIRVADFGQYIAGPLTGMLLADQGADVIKIDPVSGPRLQTPANATWNRGKGTIELDLKKESDLAFARRLIISSDVLIENFRPGVMDRLGLGADAQLAAHPRLVYCSLPGFWPDDPRSAMPAWEGVVSAATAVYRRSVFDRPGGSPVYAAESIASAFAAFVAAAAIAAALNVRERDGAGQHIQVPLFDAMYQAIGFVGLRIQGLGAGVHRERAWDGQYRCQDGRWIQIVGNQRAGERFVDAFGRPEWREEGLADQERLIREPPLNEDLARRLSELFATRTAEEWERFLGGINFPAAACRSTAEYLQHEHAQTPGILVRISDPELGPAVQPGPAVSMSAAPAVVRPRARIDPDARPALVADQQRPAAAKNSVPADRPPFEGVRVLDLCIVLAGPVCARTLAEMGADVIKIDDPCRERNAYHLDVNRGKRSILLDLRPEEGLEVFRQLAETADVVIENFRPGVAERLGIGYEAVRRRKPDIIYSSISAYGSTGPWAGLGGYEETVQALTGMQVRFGSAQRPALLPYAVNDYATGWLAAYAIALALWHRQRTGEGQRVEAALARTAGMIQSAHLIDFEGKTWTEPSGQSARGAGAFHRLYQARDGWLFLGGGPDAAGRIARVPGLEALAGYDGDTLEALLEGRFPDQTVEQWVEALCAAGLGAHQVNRVSQAMSDPVALARGLSVTRDHDGYGPLRHNGPAQWFTSAPITLGAPTPIPGADAASILRDIGRHGDLDALVAAGAVRLPEIERLP